MQPVSYKHPKANKVVWLSLDEADNDPARFIGYLVSALQSIDERLGQGTPDLLAMPQLPPLSAIFDEILNDLTTSDQHIILFLDDYHAITNPRLHEALEYFIEHLPPSFHLAITTREDPPFALARMRRRDRSLCRDECIPVSPRESWVYIGA